MVALVCQRQALGDGPGDLGGRQFARRGQNPVAALIELAKDARAHVVAQVVELFLELVLDQRALFLDDEDFLKPFGEFAHAFGFERPGHRDLVDADAGIARLFLGNTQVVERLPHIEVAFARGDDTEAALRGIQHDLVEPVGAGEGERRIEFVAVVTFLLGEELVGPAYVQAALRHLEVGRDGDRDAVRIDMDRGRTVHRLGHGLECDPAAREARHGPAVEAEVEEFLHARRVEDRNHRIDEGELRLVRGGGGFAGVVVTGEQQHAAMGCCAGQIAVFENVAGPVHARPLAVPHGEDALLLRVRKQVELLGAPDCGGGEVFVDGGAEDDVVAFEEALCARHLLVDGAQRGSAVAGHIGGRVEPCSLVALALHHRQAHQRLGAVQVNTPGFERVFVVEADLAQAGGRVCHECLSLGPVRVPLAEKCMKP